MIWKAVLFWKHIVAVYLTSTVTKNIKSETINSCRMVSCQILGWFSPESLRLHKTIPFLWNPSSDCSNLVGWFSVDVVFHKIFLHPYKSIPFRQCSPSLHLHTGFHTPVINNSFYLVSTMNQIIFKTIPLHQSCYYWKMFL